MRVLRLIDSFSPKNAGIWKVATSTVGKHPQATVFFSSHLPLPNALNPLKPYFVEHWQDESWDVVESHGLWQWNTRAAYRYAKKHRIPWIAVPHGMLEPWCMKQKALKKNLYFFLAENPMLQEATAIKAVSKPEATRLRKHFGQKVRCIYNPVDLPPLKEYPKDLYNITILFLGRLHHKKNPKLLLEAFTKIKHHTPRPSLVFAGPDDGEMQALKDTVAQKNLADVSVIGAVYGKEKAKLMATAHIFVLPSHSEGLPSSAVEAMAYGLQCILSEGCNFPEAFGFSTVKQTELNAENLTLKLEHAIQAIPQASDFQAAAAFVHEHFSSDAIWQQELDLYHHVTQHRFK